MHYYEVSGRDNRQSSSVDDGTFVIVNHQHFSAQRAISQSLAMKSLHLPLAATGLGSGFPLNLFPGETTISETKISAQGKKGKRKGAGGLSFGDSYLLIFVRMRSL